MNKTLRNIILVGATVIATLGAQKMYNLYQHQRAQDKKYHTMIDNAKSISTGEYNLDINEIKKYAKAEGIPAQYIDDVLVDAYSRNIGPDKKNPRVKTFNYYTDIGRVDNPFNFIDTEAFNDMGGTNLKLGDYNKNGRIDGLVR
jgi:hypothetical protein